MYYKLSVKMAECFALATVTEHVQSARCHSWYISRGRAFAHGAVGRRINPSWGGGPIELFLVPASAPRLV